MGYYDMPAMINYILKTTNREKLIYVGHSLGGGAFFMSMIGIYHHFWLYYIIQVFNFSFYNSVHPELNSKIEMMIALAPAVSVVHLRSPLILASTPFIRQFVVIQFTKKKELRIKNDQTVFISSGSGSWRSEHSF